MGGALDNGHLAVLAVLMISSLLNLVYLGELVIRGFFAAEPRAEKRGSARSAADHVGAAVPDRADVAGAVLRR